MAPFNMSQDLTGASILHYLEANSTNGGSFSVRMFQIEEYDELNETHNVGNEMLVAQGVTYFLFDFTTLELTTLPAENHTPRSEYEWDFQEIGRPASRGGYMVVFENRAAPTTSLFVGIDRDSSAAFLDIFGIPPAASLAALTGIVMVGVVVGLVALRRSKTRREKPEEADE